MCISVYLGSENPLPAADSFGIDESQLRIFEATSSPDGVHTILESKRIYYVCSHEGCGCSFNYLSVDSIRESISTEDSDLLEYEITERGRNRESLLALQKYLCQVLSTNERISMLVTWAGQETRPPMKRVHISPAYFDGDSFSLPLYTRFEITPEEAGSV